MHEPDELVALQEALLEALEHTPEQARERVGDLAPEWVAGWDDRAVRVASALVRRWTRRADATPPRSPGR